MTSRRTPTRQRQHHDDVHYDRYTRGLARFSGYWRAWLLALPFAGTVLFLLGDRWASVGPIRIPYPLGWGDPHVKAVLSALIVFDAAVLSVVAWKLNQRVTKRDPLVPVLIIGTVWLASFLLWFTAVFGWSLLWLLVFYALGVLGAAVWHLPRLDALRADSRRDEGGADDGEFAKLVSLPNAKVGKPEVGRHHIRAEIDPGVGKTADDVGRALEAIEDRVPPALTGRSWVERNPLTKKIVMVFTHNDPLEPWPQWAGPSKPGGSFQDGGRPGVYADGEPEIIHFAKWKDVRGLPQPAGHLGTVGTTQSGKSGGAFNLWTDLVWTRRDAVMVFIDCAKPGQSIAGRVLEDVVMFADGYNQAKALMGAIGRWAFARAAYMGANGHERGWTHQTYLDLALPAVLVGIDEADLVCGTTQFRDLVTKCLSAGIYVHAIMPRADGESMDTTARTAMNTWQVFGTGDDYSHLFAMTKQTVRRGGDKVTDWRNTKPGYHFLDAAPGVEERRYAMEIRTYHSEFTDLTPDIEAGREYRATLSSFDIEALGTAWQMFQPRNSKLWAALHATPAARTTTPDNRPDNVASPAASPDASPAITTDPTPTLQLPPRKDNGHMAETKVADRKAAMAADPTVNPYDTQDWSRADADAVPPVPPMRDQEPEDADNYARADPDELMPPAEDDQPNLEWGPPDERPKAPGRTAARRALEDTLRRLFESGGHAVFHNRDVIDAYPYSGSVGWFSERLAEIANGDSVYPPGFTVERLSEGEFGFVRVAEALEGEVVQGNAG
jgi:hypothetical protein